MSAFKEAVELADRPAWVETGLQLAPDPMTYLGAPVVQSQVVSFRPGRIQAIGSVARFANAFTAHASPRLI